MSATEDSRRSGSGPSAAAFLGCAAIWGSTFLVISIGNDALAPLWAASLRLVLAATLLTVITRLTRQSLPRGPALRTAALYGVLNLGLGMSLLYWGETRVSSGITAVTYATIPLTTMIAASMLGMERPVAAQWLAALLAFGGVGVLFLGQLHDRTSIPGLAAVLLGAICAASSGIALKRGPRQSALGANAIAAWVGCAVCLAGSFALREHHVIPANAAQLLPLLYLAVAGSCVAFVLYTWLLQRWPVTRLSFIAVVTPVTATVLGVVVRHEPVTAAGMTGSALVVGGVLLMMSRRPSTP